MTKLESSQLNITNFVPITSGSSKTLALSDARSTQYYNQSANYTITIPLNSSVAFPVGTTINIINATTSRLTLAATGGVTLTSLSCFPLFFFPRNITFVLIKISTDGWILDALIPSLSDERLHIYNMEALGMGALEGSGAGGAGFIATSFSTDNGGFITIQATLATSGQRAIIQTPLQARIQLRPSIVGRYYGECRIRIPTPGDATDQFVVRFGLTDSSNNADSANGVYFRNDQNNSGNWSAVTRSANVETTINSAVSPTSWRTLEFISNANHTAVEFFIDGTSIGTSTTNIIPQTFVTTYPQLQVHKNAGTNNRVAYASKFLFVAERLI